MTADTSVEVLPDPAASGAMTPSAEDVLAASIHEGSWTLRGFSMEEVFRAGRAFGLSGPERSKFSVQPSVFVERIQATVSAVI